MHFDWSVSLGTIIALVVMLFTFHQYHMANIRRFMRIEFQVGQMWSVFKKRFGISSDNPFDNGEQK